MPWKETKKSFHCFGANTGNLSLTESFRLNVVSMVSFPCQRFLNITKFAADQHQSHMVIRFPSPYGFVNALIPTHRRQPFLCRNPATCIEFRRQRSSSPAKMLAIMPRLESNPCESQQEKESDPLALK
ncbi:uncharacterized protein LOC9647824 [Selaginella moellendorffii]|uniref:uncharacterized protein LOC9647824 n=1 Tax=Selaginella moellendorffii TaxID=88036 RepID=UPI000D1C2819|nr:uncharacterized protein LOC9647824 [Selaginella moellendorffii]|eukprot:XP_024541130.1 uncharacterized protein LOC9647824 [Selaginella moellendorffii]